MIRPPLDQVSLCLEHTPGEFGESSGDRLDPHDPLAGRSVLEF